MVVPKREVYRLSDVSSFDMHGSWRQGRMLYKMYMRCRDGDVPLELGYSNVAVEYRERLINKFEGMLGSAEKYVLKLCVTN
jgi:hypothetical protein